MADVPPNRVFLPDARGGDLYLRATWHPQSATVVFSHWDGEVCVASTPVALSDSTKVIDLLVRALSEVADGSWGWPPPPRRPSPGVPSTGSGAGFTRSWPT